MASKFDLKFFSKRSQHFFAALLLSMPLASYASINITAPPYLAVGDGKTDDTAAFKSALAATGAAGGGVIYVPAGQYVISGILALPHGTTLEGDGEGATTIESTLQGSPTLILQGDYTKVKNMSVHFAGSTAATDGTLGIYTATGPAAQGYAANNIELSHLEVSNFSHNIYIDGSVNGILSDISSHNAVHTGLVGLSAQGYWSNILVVANQADGIYLSTSHNAGGVAPFMTGIQTFSNGGWGIDTTMGITLGGMPSFLNNDSQGELLIEGGSGADSGHVANVDIQFAGQNAFYPTPGYPNVSNAPGIEVTSASGPVRFTDVSMFNNNGTGMLLNVGSVQVSNVRILGSGAGGSGYCISSNGSNSIFTNVVCNTPSQISGNTTIVRDSQFSANSNTLAILQIPSGQNLLIGDNVIYNGGTAPALSISAGVTVANSSNTVIGTVSNSGSASGYYTPMFH
ncbi:glycosyl hydrolase family 28-related protein [Dyella nitratireducens]|uniref:Rhamnogalacturonase A/B/Epimerase-like pectate lyase domain-containing protein n=1 Tax=Dyella nitratireducens TaxID=1849580 RepID=A0ABQ1GAG5_9GAMM|nr:glycosyl hydrolase family 28-related protein [Dyella nitratireducens]GGA39901.1 hypothetical protein GCM10010981_31450 [Dyella nitratireducens]GLQ40502.1 hypothetical protein GCM10007902_03510 [Dyella nitratireducens]